MREHSRRNTMKLDTTALQRQTRRIQRLKEVGIGRTTVFVHDECRVILDELRPMLLDPAACEKIKVLDPGSPVRKGSTKASRENQLSPFRYPGGKSWLVPQLKQWLSTISHPVHTFIEPFAGGAMCGLSVASKNLAKLTVLGELDDEVASVWEVIFNSADTDFVWLCDQILKFEVSENSVREVLSRNEPSARSKAFKTIVKNRMQRAGIIADGAGLLKAGERGRGLESRWYPETLVDRMKRVRDFSSRVQFVHCDAFDLISVHSKDRHAVFLIDPPYTAGGKNAGARLYNHHQLDHDKLFQVMSKVAGSFIMTYDDSDEVKGLALKYGFGVEYIPMRSSHHKAHRELMIKKISGA